MDNLTQEVCKIVTEALTEAKSVETLATPIDAASNMESVAEWDSLSFVNVFMAVSEHFDADIDQDDAIQFTSVEGIVELLVEIREAA